MKKDLVREIEKIIEQKRIFVSNEKFLELESFKKRMQENGVVQKKDYEIPQVDTIGKRFYSCCASR